MAVLDFPNIPTIGQTYAGTNGVNYQWDGTVWTVPLGGAQLWVDTGTALTPTDATKGVAVPGTAGTAQLRVGARTPKGRVLADANGDRTRWTLNAMLNAAENAWVQDDTAKAAWIVA